MKKTGVLLGQLVMVALLLASGAPLAAQEEPLPDLTVEKSGPETATLNDSGFVNIVHPATVTNIGDAPAEVQSGTVLLRDETEIQGRFTGYGYGGGGGRFGIEGGGTVQHAPSERFYVAGDIFCQYHAMDNPYVMDPGESMFGRTPVRMISGGRVTNCATADPYNVIAESDETNNTDCLTTVVTGRGGS
jgi:hypothetical protein